MLNESSVAFKPCICKVKMKYVQTDGKRNVLGHVFLFIGNVYSILTCLIVIQNLAIESLLHALNMAS